MFNNCWLCYGTTDCQVSDEKMPWLKFWKSSRLQYSFHFTVCSTWSLRTVRLPALWENRSSNFWSKPRLTCFSCVSNMKTWHFKDTKKTLHWYQILIFSSSDFGVSTCRAVRSTIFRNRGNGESFRRGESKAERKPADAFGMACCFVRYRWVPWKKLCPTVRGKKVGPVLASLSSFDSSAYKESQSVNAKLDATQKTISSKLRKNEGD